MPWKETIRSAAVPAGITVVLLWGFSVARWLTRPRQDEGAGESEAGADIDALRLQAAVLKQRLRDAGEPYRAWDLFEIGRLHGLMFDATGDPAHRRSALKYLRAAKEASPDFFEVQGRFFGGHEPLPYGSLEEDPEFREFTW